MDSVGGHSDQGRTFTAWFWATIVILLLAMMYAYWHIARESGPADAPQKANPDLVWRRLAENLHLLLPETLADMQQHFQGLEQQFQQYAACRLAQLFASVDARIPVFLDFHYSLKGEYAELLSGLSGDVGSHLQRILFAEADFDRGLETALEDIGRHGEDLLADALIRINARLGARLGLDEAQRRFLSVVLELRLGDGRERFGAGELLFKGAGAVAGASIAKMVGETLLTKLSAKIAAKGTLKAGGFWAGAATGGAAGLFCGPAAWICSPLAGVTTGVAFWLATDKVVIAVDEYFHREELSLQIGEALDREKTAIEQRLLRRYRQYLRATMKDKEMRWRQLRPLDLIESAGSPNGSK